MTFLKLTALNGEPLFVSPQHIVSFSQRTAGNCLATMIETQGVETPLKTQESPEQINWLLTRDDRAELLTALKYMVETFTCFEAGDPCECCVCKAHEAIRRAEAA